MHLRIQISICLVFLLAGLSPVKAQKYLFSEPRQGGFKFVKDDRFDATSGMHFAGSGMLAVGFYKFFKADGSPHPKLNAALVSSALGLLKEFEDGYREGWGIKDSFLNQLGILSFLLMGDQLHFTGTLEQAVSTSGNYSLGLRYFKTSEFTPLHTSLGLFAHYNTRKVTEFGADMHFFLFAKTELHLGLTLATMKGDAVKMVQRPNVGLGFKLF
ncbi:hypothetical protein IIA28_02260 [candidate division KSB1 bacterium]|nr:hypothetical protein [candidate division KSB1 bacterium]